MSAPNRWSEVGALTSAGTVAATILCCLPFATGIVGASVAAVGARFAPFQPYVIAVSLGLQAFSFYQAYRPHATCAADGCDVPTSVRGGASPLVREHRRRWFPDGELVGQLVDFLESLSVECRL